MTTTTLPHHQQWFGPTTTHRQKPIGTNTRCLLISLLSTKRPSKLLFVRDHASLTQGQTHIATYPSTTTLIYATTNVRIRFVKMYYDIEELRPKEQMKMKKQVNASNYEKQNRSLLTWSVFLSKRNTKCVWEPEWLFSKCMNEYATTGLRCCNNEMMRENFVGQYTLLQIHHQWNQEAW